LSEAAPLDPEGQPGSTWTRPSWYQRPWSIATLVAAAFGVGVAIPIGGSDDPATEEEPAGETEGAADPGADEGDEGDSEPLDAELAAVEICGELTDPDQLEDLLDAALDEAGAPLMERRGLRDAVIAECPEQAEAPEEAPQATYHDPDVDDFVLDVVVLEQSCFGSAGCNVTYRIEVGYGFVGQLNPNTTYEVTYEIHGGEDRKIGTLTVTGDMYSTAERERIGTDSSESVLSAEVTRVSEF
jgi:hypothetical protein